MADKKFIEYEGEDYRDDRMYVLNIGTGTKDNKKCWVLGTYRNTISLPPTRNDFFDTYKELIDYISFIESYVKVPVKLISVGPDRIQTIYRDK